MTQIDALIKTLAEDLQPVHPLSRPWIRTARWLAILVPYVALVVLILHFAGKRPPPVLDSRFLIEQGFGVLTGIAAAMAAFASVIPGRRGSYMLWPLFPMAGWLATLGTGCFQVGISGISLHHNLWCFPYVVILGTAPAIVLWTMLRRGAPLSPSRTAALGALAAAGIGNFCVRLVHAEDVSVMLVVWHVGGVFLITALISAAGRRFLNWRSVQSVPAVRD